MRSIQLSSRQFCLITLSLCGLINIIGCLPTEEWSVSSDGRIVIPTTEGLFVFDPIALNGTNLYICGADSDLEVRHAVWSPDDKLIACIMTGSTADGPDVQGQRTWEVWLFDATSKRFKPIYKSDQTLQFLSFSPSGRYVFVAEEEVKQIKGILFNTYRLITVNIMSHEASEFLKGTAGIHSWSPDGRRIAYFVMHKVVRADIFAGAVGVYDFVSKEAKYHIYGACRPGEVMLRWSPNGSSLLFSGLTAGTTRESIPTPEELKAPEKSHSSLYIYDLKNGTISKLRDQPAVYGSWNRQGTRFLATEVPLEDMDQELKSALITLTGIGLMPDKNLVVEQDGKEFVAASDIKSTPSKPIWVSDHHILYHKDIEAADSAEETGMFLLDALRGDSRNITTSWQRFHINQIASRKEDLVKRIDSGSVQMAYRACVTLETLGGEQIATEAKKRLKSDPRPGIRAACVDLFASAAGIKGTPVLLDFLEDPEKRVRLRCIQKLGYLKVASASSSLCKLLEQEDLEIRKKAAWALGQIGDISAIPAIEKAMQRVPADDRHTYEQALKSLQKK